jgi:hypothetical protein
MMAKQEFFKESQSDKSKTRSSKEEKVTNGDIERKVLLEKGGKFEELDDIKLNMGWSGLYL